MFTPSLVVILFTSVKLTLFHNIRWVDQPPRIRQSNILWYLNLHECLNIYDNIGVKDKKTHLFQQQKQPLILYPAAPLANNLRYKKHFFASELPSPQVPLQPVIRNPSQ